MGHRRSAVATAILATLACFGAAADDAEEPKKPRNPYRGGQIRVGAFFVTNIDTKFMITPAEVPIGVRIASQQDLGLDDSQTTPRLFLAYRFSKRHRLDFGWYRIARSGEKTLSREITFDDTTFRVDSNVESFVTTNLYKFAYTWLFHEDEKVTLGLSAGLHTTAFDLGIQATGDIVPLSERESLTAPLPVLGGRLVYRISPKLGVVVAGDFFFLRYDAYEGSMADFYSIVEYRVSKHFGIGGGLNVFNLTVEVANDEINADLSHVYSGGVLYLSAYF
jgi:hypothetical protein